MDTSAAGEGSSFTFRVKQEPGQSEPAGPPVATGDDSGRTIRKVTVLDPLKLKLLSRQNHNMLLSGLNAAKAKAKPPAPTPPPTVPTTVASTSKVTATEGEQTNTTVPCMTADPEPSVAVEEPATKPTPEPPPVAVATKPAPPAVVAKPPGAGGGSNLFRRKKVVPAVIAKKIAQKEKAKPAQHLEAAKEVTPAKTPPITVVPPLQPVKVEQTASNEDQPAAPAATVAEKGEPAGEEVIRPTAFRRIKPKVAICLNPSRPKKSILKKNSSSELLPGSKSSLKDLIPEETIVLEDDDDDENEMVRIEQPEPTEGEEQKRNHQHEEEQRIRVEDERRNKHEEERKAAAEERRRIEEEDDRRKKAEERRRIAEEERKKAEERRRIEEEEKKKSEERQRIEEEERKKAEERRRMQEEERKKAEERQRIEKEEMEKAEHQRRIEEEEKKKAEEKAKIDAEDRSKIEAIRKSRKIPAEVWKRQMEKMRTNPNRLHSAVTGSEPSQSLVVPKGFVIVKKSDVTSVEAPVVARQQPEQIVHSAEQRTVNPTKEIRRICPLPPSVARKLMNCVALNLAKEPVKPSDAPKISEPAHVVAAESSPAVSQTKAIRRISRLPPNLASVVVSAVKQSTTAQGNHGDREEQNLLAAAVPEKAPIAVKRTEDQQNLPAAIVVKITEETDSAAPPTKEIKRIARLPPDIARKLLSSVVYKKKAIAEAPATAKPETTKEVPETVPPPAPVGGHPLVEPLAHHRLSAVFSQVPPQDSSPVLAKQEANPPQKEIRRISQLPRNVAMKLVDSLKQKGIAVPKLILRKETAAVPAPVECQPPNEPTTPSSTASSVPEIKIEPHEPPSIKATRRKVEILSQVILPTASYNLEELLAGKSTEGFKNTGPSGGMPLPLPMPRARKPTTSVPVSPVPPAPAPIHDLPAAMEEDPIMKDDVASEVTVTTEKDETLETSDEYIIPEHEVPSDNGPVQYGPPSPKNTPQRQEAPRHQSSVQQTVFSSSQTVPTSQQYAVSYATSSSQPIYPQTMQAPVANQHPTSLPSGGQPSITYFAKIPNTQPSSQPTPMPYRQPIAIISRVNPPRMMAHQRMVLNPASVQQQHPPPEGQRPRFAAAQYVLVRHPAPVRGRTVPTQIQPQLQPQQSRQHLMVPKAAYYHRYPADGQNPQHQVIYPSPRFLISTQPQIRPHLQPPQRPPQFDYVVPSISGQNKAFRPFEPAQPTQQNPRVIPKIVIDRSYVEQQPEDRSPQFSPSTPPYEQPKPLQNHSPCSEEIRNKLRDKLRSRMLQQKSESPSLEPPPSSIPLSPPPLVPMASQPPTVPKVASVSENYRIPTIPRRNVQVYLPQDFQQPRMQLARVSQPPPPKPTTDNRVIKQYICQGRKIYLTKISVTKPPQAGQSRPHEQQYHHHHHHQQSYQSETGFHGFPQAVIRNDQRIFQQFSETVQQLERKISPEPPEDGGIGNLNVANVVRGRIKSRKPSVVTAVTTGLQGETFIITELVDPPEVAQEVQIEEVKTEAAPAAVKLPPRITTRRKTFVLDDSDVELRAGQLPWVETTTSQEESQGEEKVPAEVKVEHEERDRSTTERRSAFDRQRVKEEEFSDSDTSLADEDLARDILALVEKERKSLRFDTNRVKKKVKKRIKRRKRRKRKKNVNEELMNLLMKHVNQESLIADIVAKQQKRLPVVEISDTDTDDANEGQVQRRMPHVVHVKKDPDAAAEPTVLRRSTESEVEIDSDESETTDIFAEILKPFVEENKQVEEEEVETVRSVTVEPQKEEEVETAIVGDVELQKEEEKMETASAVAEEPQKEEEMGTAIAATVEPQEQEKMETASAVTAERQEEDSRKEKKKVETMSVVAEEPQEEESRQDEEKVETVTSAVTANTQEEEKAETTNAVTAEDPQQVQSRQEEENVETTSAVVEEPQERECSQETQNVETASAVTAEAQTEECAKEEEKVETASAVAGEPQQEDGKQQEEKTKVASALTEEALLKDTPVEQSIDVPKVVTDEPEISEISAEIASDPNPVVVELNQPTTKSDQICDTTSSALKPVKESKPKKAPAPRAAPKRKLKPTLVSRSKKIRKVEPPPPVPVEIKHQCATADDIEDSSDPLSDRDEPPPPAAIEESEPQEVHANEALDAIKPTSVRELVGEWDSDEEASKDVTKLAMLRSFRRHVSFDNNGNVPCRVSKNNALKRSAAMLNDPVVEVSAIEKPIEEASVQATEAVPVPAPTPTEVKSVRVSVRKTDLLERGKSPEPVAAQVEEPVAGEDLSESRVESTKQSVLNLLKDWDESPVKQRSVVKPRKVVARALLDRIDSDEVADLKKIDQSPVAVQSETLTDKPEDDSVERQSAAIVLENIALTDLNRWDEPSASEPERIIARIIYDDKEPYETVHGVPKDRSTEPDDGTSHAVITQDCPSRQTRSHGKLDVVPSVTAESPATRSRLPKPATIKAWLSSTTNESPPKEPVIERQKPVPKARRSARDRAAEKVVETQKPAGRTLRSRTKSMFAEKAPLAEEPPAAPEAESTETTVEEAPSESHTEEVMKEAGGTACTARKREEQESKECSTTTNKPVPIVSNRVPIQISSEDEDDAPLAKRRKVLRKRRSMMRQRDRRVRDLSANRRLFRSGGGAHRGTLIADGNYLGETTFIKTEPPEDVAETPDEYYPVPQHESFAVITPEANTERLLSVVTVQNNQIVHAENYDVETPPRKKYFSKDLVQQSTTEPIATSTPIQASAPAPLALLVPTEEHVFATPEPVRVAKRKRRTKQELEADRLAKKQLKTDEEAAVEQAGQQETKPRQKRDIKPFYVPIDPETVDPTIREFKCASCSEMVPRDMWDRHYAKHVGLTYRVDVDPVVDMYDETTATAIVARFMKVHRQVTIHCDKCNVAKKSALGLVSHRLICGMTKEEIEASKVNCEHCNRKLMAVSMNCHLQSHCPVLKRKKLEQSLDLEKLKAEEESSSQVDPATLNQRGTIKRKATAKAEKRIQNISFSELILTVSKEKVTDGCLAMWKTQFRKAKTALCVFQTCDFTGNDEMEMRHHHEFCPSPCELFECKNCKYQTEQIEQMAKHIKLRHAVVLASITAGDSSGTDAKMSSESSGDERMSGADENEEPFNAAFDNDEKPRKATRKSLKALLKSCNRWGNNTRDQFSEESDVYREMILDEVIELRSLKSDFHLTAREWTAEFRARNYSRRILFSALQPDLDVRFLTFNMVQEYIPKRTRSLRFMVRSTNLYNAPVNAQEYTEKWQHLEAFSGQVNDKESVFYCGGPIVALDWLPVPDGKDEHQILAVACKNDFDEFYLADRIYPTKCLIQIWDVGFLTNSNLYNKKVENSAPALLYSIACDFGPIWSLKFCPSGCYNSKDEGDQYDRLGLLAAAGSDGNVHIFSLGRNYEHLISNSYRVVNLTPVLKLTLSLEGGSSSCSQYECHSVVKLSWSKSKNHAVIAAGYSNGAVAVWNLNSTSPLLTGTRDGVRALLPVHKAFLPDSCITAVDLHYSDDTRYLLVCNADRKVVVFDLSTGYLPVEVCSVNARSKVTTACWNTHFPLITMAFDDVYAIDRCALTFHQTREVGLRLHPLYTFTAEATDMSGSDHLSTHVIGTDGGDVLCHQPMAYVHQMAQKNTQQMKYILTSTISVKVNDELTDNSYAMFYKNYGVLFSDSDKSSTRMDLRSLQVKSFRRALLHEYPGIRVNQVRWNPNDKSHQYYAIGYQAGFVRVRAFRFK